jgi:hypothetical protein
MVPGPTGHVHTATPVSAVRPAPDRGTAGRTPETECTYRRPDGRTDAHRSGGPAVAYPNRGRRRAWRRPSLITTRECLTPSGGGPRSCHHRASRSSAPTRFDLPQALLPRGRRESSVGQVRASLRTNGSGLVLAARTTALRCCATPRDTYGLSDVPRCGSGRSAPFIPRRPPSAGQPQRDAVLSCRSYAARR